VGRRRLLSGEVQLQQRLVDIRPGSPKIRERWNKKRKKTYQVLFPVLIIFMQRLIRVSKGVLARSRMIEISTMLKMQFSTTWRRNLSLTLTNSMSTSLTSKTAMTWMRNLSMKLKRVGV
jgi:hypothetical protein